MSVPGAFAAIQIICESGLLSSLIPGLGCPRTAVTNYPTVTTVTMAPVPVGPGMVNPCADVPANAWCPA